ncbi:YrhB domain-containing protein [Nonomuraea jiangxiensis]|uniref:Immunity protein 35 n=1 Tax=Nonomuraea jiangxiensis TaxID=633440 RepID=A0A1G9HHG4_9ACTN|nr:YrhB domain-containing protein [Nonomuraea jiangxiensis]SDL12420.1 Immunity protein 35 [Nonomuraea jiangxiensis]
MLTESEARCVAEAEVARLRHDVRGYFAEDDDFVIVEMEEYPIGWVYYYQSSRYLRTRRMSAALMGNAPVLIDRRDGSILPTGTAHAVEHYIREHEQSQG